MANQVPATRTAIGGWAIAQLLLKRTLFRTRALLPCHRIANADNTTIENTRKNSAAPFGLKGVAEAGSRFIHALARGQLAANLDAAGADPQHAAACVGQLDPADQDVGPTTFRAGIMSEPSRRGLPRLARQDGDLATTAPANAPLHSLPGDERCLTHGVHTTAVRAFTPELFDETGHSGPND